MHSGRERLRLLLAVDCWRRFGMGRAYMLRPGRPGEQTEERAEAERKHVADMFGLDLEEVPA